jgi:carboxyl-terminal processing protease
MEIENSLTPELKSVSRHPLLWGLTLFFLICTVLCGSIIYLLSDDELTLPFQIEYTLSLIKQAYPESYNSVRMMTLARDAIFTELDRYSGYLAPEELNRVEEEFTGEYCGVGIMVVGHTHGLLVMSVREDGPAGRAGMKTGDIIIRVDTTNMEGLNPYRSTYYLRGPEGSTVMVAVARNSMADTIEFKLFREKLRLSHLAFAGITENKSLYLRLLDFEAGAAEEVLSAVDSLYFKRKDTVKGVIIDLRGNPGGLVGEAASIANLFLPSGRLIVGVKGRSRWHRTAFYSNEDDITGGLPMAIIVDRGSASASEIFAGAMRYSGRGFLVGDTTFGKGLVQEFDPLDDGSGLRLTTARYYFEGDIFLNDPKALVKDSAAGIPPDYYYQPIDYDPYPLRLENSLLMRDYAMAHQDEIVGDSGLLMNTAGWYDGFLRYLEENKFRYESDLTRLIRGTIELLNFEGYQKETIAAMERFCELSRKDDDSQLQNYREFIRQQLYQIALESKYGAGAAYKKAILPFRQDISLAEKLFRERRRN